MPEPTTHTDILIPPPPPDQVEDGPEIPVAKILLASLMGEERAVVETQVVDIDTGKGKTVHGSSTIERNFDGTGKLRVRTKVEATSNEVLEMAERSGRIGNHTPGEDRWTRFEWTQRGHLKRLILDVSGSLDGAALAVRRPVSDGDEVLLSTPLGDVAKVSLTFHELPVGGPIPPLP